MTSKRLPKPDRRNVLQTIGGTAGFVGLIPTTSNATATESASIHLADQESDGDSLVVQEVTTSVEGIIRVRDLETERETGIGERQLESGTHNDITIELAEPITRSQEMEALFLHDQDMLDYDRAHVAVGQALETTGSTFVDADPDAGFNYPYFLYTPENADRDDAPILVHPNNTGTATDDFTQHQDRAQELVESEGGLTRTLSEELSVPLLVPVFPRPESEPVDWTHYVQQLDRETLKISEGPLERVDLQLLQMVDHAKHELLEETAYSFSDQVILHGFSASGNFVDRFTMLHPERVQAVSAGGINGMTVLPLDELDGTTLPFHIGIADVEEITGEPVNLDALDDVDQFFFMGEFDPNDTITFDDAWTEDELTETAVSVYGRDMISERFPQCQTAYEDAGIDAQFRIYEGLGHEISGMADDIIEFHQQSLAGEDVAEFGEDLSVWQETRVLDPDRITDDDDEDSFQSTGNFLADLLLQNFGRDTLTGFFTGVATTLAGVGSWVAKRRLDDNTGTEKDD